MGHKTAPRPFQIPPVSLGYPVPLALGVRFASRQGTPIPVPGPGPLLQGEPTPYPARGDDEIKLDVPIKKIEDFGMIEVFTWNKGCT